MSKISKYIALIVSLLVVTTSLFVVHEYNHDCVGEDCPICAYIEIAQNSLRSMHLGGVQRFEAILTALVLVYTFFCNTPQLLTPTLVTAKIKLNN